MNTSYKYRAFISYSHHDKPFAKWLQKGIESYTIPRKLYLKYPHLPKNLKRSLFRDDEELSSASVLSDTLAKSIEESKRMIVICSVDVVNSKWVKEEIKYFKKVHGKKNIYSIIKSGEPKDVLPSILGKEHLTVDAKTNRKIALLKMVAVVLDVDFSDLWEREKRESKKRYLIIATVVAIFVSLLLYSMLQFKAISSNKELESIDTKMSSIEYRIKRGKLAKEEVYVLQNKLQKLTEIKRVKEETLKWFGMFQTTMSKKAKNIYDEKGVDAALALLESGKSIGEDISYAKKNMLRAKLYIEKNDYKNADKFYKKAIAVDDCYVNMYDYVLFLMKENETQEAQLLLKKLYTYDLPMEQRANILNRLGINYRKLKQLDKAKLSYMAALKLRKKLAKENFDKYSLDLAWTYNNLGVLYKKTNEFNAAKTSHTKAFAIRKALAKKDAKKYTFYLTCSMHNLGELYCDINDTNKAEIFFKKAIKIRRELLENNPKKYMPALASTLHELAKLYMANRNFEKAEVLYEEALAFRRILQKNNPKAYEKMLQETLVELDKLHKKMGMLKSKSSRESEK